MTVPIGISKINRSEMYSLFLAGTSKKSEMLYIVKG